jgi:hypothetical protein
MDNIDVFESVERTIEKLDKWTLILNERSAKNLSCFEKCQEKFVDTNSEEINRSLVLFFIPYWGWQFQEKDGFANFAPYGDLVIPASEEDLERRLRLKCGKSVLTSRDFDSVISLVSNLPYVSRHYHFMYNTELSIINPTHDVKVSDPCDEVGEAQLRVDVSSKCSRQDRSFGDKNRANTMIRVLPFEKREQRNSARYYHGYFPVSSLSEHIDIRHKSTGVSVLVSKNTPEYTKMLSFVNTIYRLSIPISKFLSILCDAISLSETTFYLDNAHKTIESLYALLVYGKRRFDNLCREYTTKFLTYVKTLPTNYIE